MTIERFGYGGKFGRNEFGNHPEGEFVRYSDHAAEVERLERERNEARRLLHKAIEGPWSNYDLQVARDFLNKEPSNAE